MRAIGSRLWKGVAAGWVVAAAGMWFGDVSAAALYVFYQAFVARAPGVTLSAEQVTQLLSASNGVLAAGLCIEGLLTTLGGFLTARMTRAAGTYAGIKVLAVLCELTAILFAYASAASAPVWYYAASFLFPLPLVLLGGALAYSIGDGVGYAFAPTVPPRPAAPPTEEDCSAPYSSRQ